jgi:sulfite exporter TauE/SafE
MTFGIEHSSFSIQAAIVSGLLLGVASSAHCAAMCGPLVLIVSRRIGGPSRRSQVRHAVLYHAGRVVVYLALALPAGMLGQALVASGFGRVLAIGTGVLLLAAAAGAVRFRPLDDLSVGLSALLARASAPALGWAADRPVTGALLAGAFNGLLPCGLVYAAMTAAAASGGVTGAVLLMAGFGAGTAGVLVAISLFAASISLPVRVRLRPVAPLVLAVTAAILIARGAWPHQHPAEAADPAAPAHMHVHDHH